MSAKTLVTVAISALGIAASVQIRAQSPAAISAGPTYSRDVAPILNRNCTSCHRPGEIGPMSLLSYQAARPWAKAIGTRVTAGTMPPWHADPAVGEFSNDRRLSAAEKEIIAQWVAAGAAESDPND